MIYTHALDPVIATLGPVTLHWYGLMYALGFFLTYIFLRSAVRQQRLALALPTLDTLLVSLAIGVVVGGRLGYFVLYDSARLLADPLALLAVWQGGMSFHGGFVGALVALFLVRRWAAIRLPFLVLSDLLSIPAALGIALGRVGNFINGELWGRTTDGAWGVIFPLARDGLARHPSQLYEALYAGVIALILFFVWQKKPAAGVMSALFLLLYGIFRTGVELVFREPLDGFFFFLPLGAAYSLPMIVGGGVWLAWLLHAKK